MTVLRIVEPIDRPVDSRTRLCSFLISLLLHAGLAVLLWCVVYVTVQFEPISLAASFSPGSQIQIPLELVDEEVGSENPLPAPQNSSPSEWQAPVDLWVAKAVKSDSVAEEIRQSMEPASIDFFGTRAYGNRFVFVLDISYSMNARDGARFDRAREELLRSVSQLRAGQSYYVFLFCWNTEKMFRDRSAECVNVTAGHEEKLRRWISDVSLGAGTDPRRALSLARQMKPDAVFLLSDGHFNRPRTPLSETGWIDEQGNRLKKLDVQKGVERFFGDIPIHTIALENPFTYAAMEQIAKATDGSYRYVKTSSHKPIDAKRFLSALRHIDQEHRDDPQPNREYQTRLSYAREFIADGELVYAEYLIRPLRHADRSKIANLVLLDRLSEILDAELGDTRLEDFEPVPDLRDVVSKLP